jgi:hypothetical protein
VEKQSMVLFSVRFSRRCVREPWSFVSDPCSTTFEHVSPLRQNPVIILCSKAAMNFRTSNTFSP